MPGLRRLPWDFCHLGTLVLHSGRRRYKGKRGGLIPPVTHLHPAALRRALARGAGVCVRTEPVQVLRATALGVQE